MRVTKRQLRRIIREERTRLLQEFSFKGVIDGAVEIAKDLMLDPTGILISGAGVNIDEQFLKSLATPDAWTMFKAIGGAGTNEYKVKKVMQRRAADLPELYREFEELRRNLVEERSQGMTYVLQFMLGSLGSTVINGIMVDLQDRDLVAWLRGDGMDEEADILEQAVRAAGVIGESRRATKRQLRNIVRKVVRN